VKILLLDIETAPNLATVWGLFKQNIAPNQLLESSYTLCWAAKWYGEKSVLYDSVYQSSPKRMLKGIHRLLEEADVLVHYNGTKFDIPTLNKEFLLHGFKPPAPSKNVDLLQTARRAFRFPSNRLDYVANALGLGQKHKTTHELWLKCMDKDPEAWKQMESYNRQDVLLLEKVYDKFKPWIKSHPSWVFFDKGTGGKPVCPTCGSTNSKRRGFFFTQASKFQRYQCGDCRHWYRSGPRLKSANPSNSVGV
jgi:DNA polymerase elongation subunit (family B)